MRFGGFGVKFCDDFGGDGIAGLVAIYGDEEAEVTVVSDDGEGFVAEFGEAVTKDLHVAIVGAGATVAENLGGFEARFDIGFGNVQNDDSLDVVAGGGSGKQNLVFFARPTSDRREDKWGVLEVGLTKIGKHPFVKNIGRNEVATAREVLAKFGFFFSDDVARA